MTVISPRARVLFATAERVTAAVAMDELSLRGFATAWRGSVQEALAALGSDEYDAVIASDDLPGDALAMCLHLSADQADVRAVIAVREASFAGAVEAMRAGAWDVVCLPLESASLMGCIDRVLQRSELRSELRRLRQVLAEARGFEDLLGASQPMQRMYAMLERAAETNASVLITGESGTGKEVVARALHRRSRRKDGPIVAINCSALPESLLESELFGHVKGAFTDAKVARSGLFVMASGGTLLLDEIGDMPLALQPKLLRALQERRVKPVGSDVEVPFDVRVVAATNQNLEVDVAERKFREDLYYRINVIHIEVPALRDRGADVLLLAEHYVQHFATQLEKQVSGVSHAAAEKLLAYDWPGNVRELQNCLERAVALTRDQLIQLDDLPDKVQRFRRSHVLVVSNSPAELLSMEEIERRYILRVLEAVKGNKKEAARILGFDRRTLYRKLDRYGLDIQRLGKANK